MNRTRLRAAQVIACLLSLLIGSAIGASAPRTFLPIVAAQPPNVQDAMIYSCQCGAVIAAPMADGRVLLTIQDHSQGGALVVGVDDGVTFTLLPDSQQAQLIGPPGPSYQFPGDKQGIGSSLQVWGRIVTWAPNRLTEEGRYEIWRDVHDGKRIGTPNAGPGLNPDR